jgi:hypothetical protein
MANRKSLTVDMQPKIISMDLGTTTSKFAAQYPDGSINMQSFPSAVTTFDVNINYERQPRYGSVIGYNHEWLVFGDEAAVFGQHRQIEEPQDSGRYFTDTYLKLINYAVFCAYGGWNDAMEGYTYQNAKIQVALSIPASVQREKSSVNEIVQLIGGKHVVFNTAAQPQAFHFEIDPEVIVTPGGITAKTTHRNILVLPEGAGAAYVFTQYAVNNGMGCDGVTLVIDIGGQTTDIVGYKNGVAMSQLSDSIALGGIALSQLLFPPDTKTPGTLIDRVSRMNTWIETNTGRYENSPHVQAVGRRIVDFIARTVQSAGIPIGQIVLFGGYSPVFAKVIQRSAKRISNSLSNNNVMSIADVTQAPESVYMANAAGGLEIAKAVFAKRRDM